MGEEAADKGFKNIVGKEYFADVVSKEIWKRIEKAIYMDCTKASIGHGVEYRRAIGNLLNKKCIPGKFIYDYKRRCEVYGNNIKDDEVLRQKLNAYTFNLVRVIEGKYPERYESNIVNIWSDNFKELEVSGVTKHAREYTIEFNLGDCIDLALSEVFGIPRIEVRNYIEDAYESYDLFSEGIMCQNDYLLGLDGYSLDKLIRMSDKFSNLLYCAAHKEIKSVITNYGEVIKLDKYNLDAKSKIYLTFYVAVLKFSEAFIKSILENWYREQLNKVGPAILVTSISFSSVVFQSTVPIEDEIFAELDSNAVILKPIVSKQEEYYKHIGRSDLVCYI